MERRFIVYCHINELNNKKYIGITSQKVNKRWQNGFGYKSNKYLTNSIEKYGWSNFKHIILFENLEEKIAKEVEIELIKKYNTIIPNGYNITKGGDGTSGISRSGKNNPRYGVKPTEETIEKIRKSNTGKKFPERCGENSYFSKVVFCEDKSFVCAIDCAKFYEIDILKMYQYLNAKGNIPEKFILGNLRYENEELDIIDRIEAFKGKRRNGKKFKSVICLDTLKVYPKIIDASKDLGIDSSCIVRCCNGKYLTAGGYKWKYYK